MSNSWLNTFHDGLDEQNTCSRDAQLGEYIPCLVKGASISWEALDKKPIAAPAMDDSRVLKPHFTGSIVSKEMEEKLLPHAFEWSTLMVPAEADREVFEAFTLVIVFIAEIEEGDAQPIEELGALEEINVCGYTIQVLLDILGRVLIPSLILRLKQLILGCIQAQERHEFPNPQERIKMYLNMKTSYDKGFILSLAAAGVSGEGLTVGLIGDIVECLILTHDSQNIVRHFAEEDIANLHRYAPGTTAEKLSRAFLRMTLLSTSVAWSCPSTSSEPSRTSHLLLSILLPVQVVWVWRHLL
ncbi:hypothetical protein DSO57_1001128 [Entomophthora muscae]|uniref:Uncharacterized protein n=1 Tax=Entomophthora muscae TaxID=34485 RepID=A0ACC2S0A3_9FUNG|nr:hypothetical protein DSO57_1001128 [Entomophthora muscae]